jgi:hypothetical protein
MNNTLIAGTVVVNLALVFYTISFIMFSRSHSLSRKLLTIFSLGLFFDVLATTLMILGSTNSPFTLHGFIGYSALLTMFVEGYILWNFYYRNGFVVVQSASVKRYTAISYIWWVCAYISGAIIAIVL